MTHRPYPLTSTLLPADARRLLIEASYEPKKHRSEAVSAATEKVKDKYPRFFQSAREISTLLPREVRNALIEASKLVTERERRIAVDAVVSRARLHCPECFIEEKEEPADDNW